MSLFIDPLVSFDPIAEDELNWCLVEWGHQMGPLKRPPQYGGGAHGLRHNGRLVAVTAWSTLVRKNCAGMDFLPRGTTTELSRVCAERPDLCRVVVRLWREFVFPAVGLARKHEWAVSYQDGHLHSGDLYRNDGWVKLGVFKSGAVDPRSGRAGRTGFVWGWRDSRAIRQAFQLRPKLRRAWSRKTSYWPERWSPQAREVGQCAVTALAIREALGGLIVEGEVHGERHYWNRIDGEDVDLTFGQFPPGSKRIEIGPVTPGTLLEHPDTAARYRHLCEALKPEPLAEAA